MDVNNLVPDIAMAAVQSPHITQATSRSSWPVGGIVLTSEANASCFNVTSTSASVCLAVHPLDFSPARRSNARPPLSRDA